MIREIANFSILLLSLSMVGVQAHGQGLSAYLSDGCMKPLPCAKEPVFDENCIPKAYDERVNMVALPLRVQNWGSGGKGGLPWRFKEERCNDFFISLQAHIEEVFPEIRQSPHDLFHAHLIGYGEDNKRMAAVFHAKEYPRDLEKIKNHYQVFEESFFSSDASFEMRNFVYIGDDIEVPRGMYRVDDRSACHELFLEYSQNTLGEDKLSAQLGGINLGDVNIFQIKDLARIKYNNYSTIMGSEEKNSGKSLLERMRINVELEEWIAEISSKKFLYFLTGFQR